MGYQRDTQKRAASLMAISDMHEMKLGEESTLDMGDFTVTVQRRSDDWMTYLNGNKGVWSCHSDMRIAVWNTIVTYFEWIQTLENSDDEDLLDMAENVLLKQVGD